MPLAGILPQRFQGTGANLTAWRINHTQKRVVVIRVYDEAQIAHHILDFGFGEERRATADAIGNLVLLEFDFEQARLMIATIKNGVVTKFALVAHTVSENFSGNSLGFGVFVSATHHAYGIAKADFAPQGFFKCVRVVRDQMIGNAQDATGRTVILFEFDNAQLWKVMLEQ